MRQPLFLFTILLSCCFVFPGAQAEERAEFAEYLKKSELPELYRTELRALCLERCDLGACRELVEGLNREGRPEEALDLTESIRCEPERIDFSSRLIRAQALYHAGHYKDAISLLDELIGELPPKDLMVESIFIRAQCKLNIGDAQYALIDLKSIEPYIPESVRSLYLFYLARCEEEAANLLEAERLYKQALKGTVEDPALGLMRCSLKRGDLERFRYVHNDFSKKRRRLFRRAACELAPSLDVLLPEIWRMLMRPALSDTEFTALGCPDIVKSIGRMAEAGEDVQSYCDALLGRPLTPEAEVYLRYARALSLSDSAGVCDTLVALSRQASEPESKARCLMAGVSLAVERDRLGLVAEIAPRLTEMAKDLRPQERLELARIFVEARLEQRGQNHLNLLLKDLEAAYDHAAVFSIASIMARAGNEGKAQALYESVAKSPMPSMYTLMAERSIFLLAHMTPSQQDIAAEVARLAQQGASDVDLGDLFVEKLGDFERAAVSYRSALDTMPAGPQADPVRVKLVVPLVLGWIETGDDGLREEALDLVAEVADTNHVPPGPVIEALKLSTDWLELDRTRAFETIQKLSVRDDLTSSDLNELARMLYHLFASRDGNVYAQCVMVLKRLAKEFPTSPEAPLGGLLLARMKFLAGDYVGGLEAFQACQQVWRKPPISDLCQMGIGDCYLYSGGISEALDHYGKAGENTGTMYNMATCYDLIGQADSAIVYYRKTMSKLLSPSLLEAAKLRLGLLLSEQAGTGAALEEVDSVFPDVRLDLARTGQIVRAHGLGLSGYQGLAAGILSDIVSAEGSDLSCKAILIAAGLAGTDDPTAALEILEAGEANCDDISGVFSLLHDRAHFECVAGPLASCSAQAETFERRFPLDQSSKLEFDALELLLMYREGETDLAGTILDSLIVAGNRNQVLADAFYRHGIQKLVDGDPRRAAEIFHLIESDYREFDLYYDTCFKLGTSYYLLERYDSSATYFELASGSGKASLVENALFNLALALEEAEQLDDAAAAFWKHAMTFPLSERFERSLLRSAYTLESAGHPAEAIPIYEGLLQYAGTVEAAAEAMYWIGESYAEMGEELRAACEFLRVAYMFPDAGAWTGTAAFRAGIVCEEAGFRDHAVRIYRDNVRRFGTGSDWGKASEERLIELEPEP